MVPGANVSVLSSRQIDLARVPPFRLGALQVIPAVRELQRGDRRERLEPRVMQVLVALWQASGGVVSHDDLIARCWDGRIVGENAIHRTASRIREIAAGIGQGCFQLETVSKVGYRLQIGASAAQPSVAPALPFDSDHSNAAETIHSRDTRLRPGRWNRTVIAAGALVAIAVVTFLARMWWPESGDISIAVDTTGAGTAVSVTDELARTASASGGVSFIGRPDERADFGLQIHTQHLGNRVLADVSLAKGGAKDVLWSASFAASDPATLSRRIAYAAYQTIDCARSATNDMRRLDNGQLRLLYSACDHLENVDDPNELTVDLWRQVVQSEQDDSRALAMFALVEATSANASQDETPSILARRASATKHFQTARAKDARLGLTYAAEAILIPPSQYQERFNVLNRGIALDPGCAILHVLDAQAWADVGKLERAIASARRAVELNPAETRYRDEWILRLAYGGYTQTAAAELRDAERIWPDSPIIQDTRAHFDFRFGDAKQLLEKITSGYLVPDLPRPWTPASATSFLLARASPTPGNVAAAIRDAARVSRTSPFSALVSLVDLGAIDQAYAALQDPANISRLRHGPEIIFRTDMRSLLFDRRFMPVANKLGLVQFWLTSGLWPDFCGEKGIPYDCQAEAKRLRAHCASASNCSAA